MYTHGYTITFMWKNNCLEKYLEMINNVLWKVILK